MGSSGAALAAATSPPRVASARVTTGDVALPQTSNAWASLAGFELSIPAAVGEWVEIAVTGMSAPAANSFLDVAVKVSNSLVRFLSLGTGTPAAEGEPSLYPQPTAFRTFGLGAKGFVVESGDLDGGNVRFVLAVKAAGSGTLYASTIYPFYWRAVNLRAPA